MKRARLMILVALALSGCVVQRKPAARAPYTGPTEPMARVVAEINSNNAQLPTLWSRIKSFEVTVFDDKGSSHSANGYTGNLLFRKPRDLYVTGSEPTTTVFTIGSNSDRFWVASPDTLWWGNYKNLGKQCVQDMPIRPDLIVEVLGISDINTNFMQEPLPTMRFNNDADAYMFTWQASAVSLPRRLVAQKEVWYDRSTKLPELVLLFDENGRVLLRAYLSHHLPVEIEGVAPEKRPKVATDYKLYFPESGSKFWLVVEDVTLKYKNFPNDKSFRFDQVNFGDHKKIQIDKDCGP